MLTKGYRMFLTVILLVLSLSFTSCVTDSADNRTDITEEGTENSVQSQAELIAVLQEHTTDEIIGIYDEDYDMNGTLEAYFVTSEADVPDGADRGRGLKFWFVNGKEAQLLMSGELSVEPSFYEYADKILVGMYSYSRNNCDTSVYFVSKNYAHSYGSFGGRLVRSSHDPYLYYLYKKGSDVIAYISDNISYGDSEKPYYLSFDGNFFAEYGGVTMREDQLRAFLGADSVLTAISEGRYHIVSIYRRNNGVININISKDNGNGTLTNENVTLLSVDGELKLVPIGENENPLLNINNGTLVEEIVSKKFSNPELFSYHGHYTAAALPNLAVYAEEK